MAQKKIDVIIDVVVDKANGALGSFKRSIQDADGAAGKFKAGATGAFDAVKANAGTLALAGGAALVTFGAKAVAAFQELALESGRMSQSLGIPVETMSRLIEVAGDLGIESGTLEAALGKMNQTAGKTPAAFEAIGAEIVKTETGATDVNATFMATVDALNRIEDPAKRAAAAQQIFGRSWRDSAELIGLSSKQITEAMGEVSDAKVINEDEVRRAREFRDKLQNLQDKVEDLSLSFGGPLVDGLSDAAGAAIMVADTLKSVGLEADDLDKQWGKDDGLFDPLIRSAEMVINPLGSLKSALEQGSAAVGELTGVQDEAVKSAEDAAESTDENTDALGENTDEVEGNTQALKQRVDALEKSEEAERGAQSASLSYRQQVADTTEAVRIATLQQLDATLTDEQRAQAARDAEGAVLAQAEAAVKLAEDQAAANGETLSAKVKTQIYIDELRLLAETLGGPARAEIEAHIRRLMDIPASIYTNLGIIRGGDLSPVVTGRRASGGPVTPGGTYLVGEQGPELLQLGNTSGNVVNAPQTAAALSGSAGGVVYNFTINDATDPDRVVQAIRQHVRRNGPIQGIT